MRYLSCFLLLGVISATAQQTAPVDPDLIYRRAEARQQHLNQSVTPQDFSTLDFSAPAADETLLSQEAREASPAIRTLRCKRPVVLFTAIWNELWTPSICKREDQTLTAKHKAASAPGK